MAHAAILGIVAFSAVHTYISRVIFIIIFGDQVIQIIMTSTATLFSFHAFHTVSLLVCMVARRTRLPDVFTEVKLVIEDDLAIIRIKDNGFG
jgi:hypothetical protein